jgi:glycosyltransferase involved in cell wall biosynthesis
MERKKIVFIVDALTRDGDARYLEDLLRHVDRARYRYHVVSLGTPLGVAIDVQKLAVPVHSLDLPDRARAWWTFAGTLTLFNLFRMMAPDLVHTVGSLSDVCGRTAARLAQVPWVVSTQRRSRRVHGIRQLVARFTGHLADVVIAPTHALAGEAVDGGGVHPRRVRVIPPGVDLGRVLGGQPLTEQLVTRPLIGTVGRLDDDSLGIDVLIDAVAILRRHIPTLGLLVAGTGAAGIRAVRRAQRLGIEAAVSLPGERQDIDAVLASLDVFVHPSRHDALPLALLEAMAAGLPCVTTDLPSIREHVDDGRHALLVPRDHPALLADAIDRLLVDRDLAQSLGLAATALVRDRFPSPPMAAAHEDLYERLLLRRV